jgi:hypothetical protein
MITSNLPINTTSNPDSAKAVRSFFDGYYVSPTSFPAEHVDAVVGFFKARGFDDIAANSTTIILLQQAKTDNVDIFSVLDTLKGLSAIQLSSVVSEVLNYNRQRTSVLGYRQSDNNDYFENRNIRI